jgi:hypothetical protein
MIKLDKNTTSACKKRPVARESGSNGGVVAQSVSQDNSATGRSPVESSALLRPVSQLQQRGLPCGELSGTQRS